MGKVRAYHGGPNARDGHVFASLALKVHGESLGQHAHADFAHSVGRLAAEEAAVNWRADDDDAAARAHVREGGLDSGVEALWVDALHELEALQGRGWHGSPEDGTRVVDQDVDAAVCLKDCVSGLYCAGGSIKVKREAYRECLRDKSLDALWRADVNLDGGCIAAGRSDLTGDGGDGGGWRVGVWRERDNRLGRVADGLGCDDHLSIKAPVSSLDENKEHEAGGRTGVAVAGEVNGDLTANATGGTDNEGNRFIGGHG